MNAEEIIKSSLMSSENPHIGVKPIHFWIEKRIKKIIKVTNDYLDHDKLRYIYKVAALMDEAILLAELYQEIYELAPEGDPADVIKAIVSDDKLTRFDKKKNEKKRLLEKFIEKKRKELQTDQSTIDPSKIKSSRNNYEAYRDPKDDRSDGSFNAVLRLRKKQ